MNDGPEHFPVRLAQLERGMGLIMESLLLMGEVLLDPDNYPDPGTIEELTQRLDRIEAVLRDLRNA